MNEFRILMKIEEDRFHLSLLDSRIHTHPRADMPNVPPSRVGYAQQCAPSPFSCQYRHLNSVLISE